MTAASSLHLRHSRYCKADTQSLERAGAPASRWVLYVTTHIARDLQGHPTLTFPAAELEVAGPKFRTFRFNLSPVIPGEVEVSSSPHRSHQERKTAGPRTTLVCENSRATVV